MNFDWNFINLPSKLEFGGSGWRVVGIGMAMFHVLLVFGVVGQGGDMFRQASLFGGVIGMFVQVPPVWNESKIPMKDDGWSWVKTTVPVKVWPLATVHEVAVQNVLATLKSFQIIFNISFDLGYFYLVGVLWFRWHARQNASEKLK